MNIRKGLSVAALALAMTLTCSLNVLANESKVTEETRITTEAGMKEEAGYINASNVRLRSEGNLNARTLTTMNHGAKLTILGKEGEWYKVIHNDSNGYVFNEFVTLGDAAQIEMNGDVELLDWWNGCQSLMRAGTVATVTDVSTGIQFQIQVIFGTNHADAEPLTADDTAKMRQTRDGQWSWSPRAIWVTLENGRTIAASANSMPHGRSSIHNNNFPGHFCIHFLNSYNHGRTRVNPEHQSQVRRAFDAS